MIDDNIISEVRGKFFHKDNVYFDETENRRTQKLAYDKLMLNNMRKKEIERELQEDKLGLSLECKGISSNNSNGRIMNSHRSSRQNSGQQQVERLKKKKEITIPVSVHEASSSGSISFETNILKGNDNDNNSRSNNNHDNHSSNIRSVHFDIDEQKMMFTKPLAFFSALGKERIGTASYLPSTPCIQGVDIITRAKSKLSQRPNRQTINLIKAEKSEYILQNSPRERSIGGGGDSLRREKMLLLKDPLIQSKLSNSSSFNKFADFELDLHGLKEQLEKKKKERNIPQLHPDVIEMHETAFRRDLVEARRGQLQNYAFIWNEYDCRQPTLKGRSGWLANGSDHYSPFHGRIPR